MLIHNPYVFQLTRFLSGIAAGTGAVISGITINEMLPTQIAAKFAVSVYSILVMGVLMPAILGLVFHDPDMNKMDAMTIYWRPILVWPAIISVIRLVIYLLFYNYDTPQFYFDKFGITEYSLEKSKESLRKIYVEKDIEIVHKYLIYQYQEKTKLKEVTFMTLFTDQYKRQMFAGTMFQVFNQFCGVNFFVFYSVKIFTEIDQDPNIATFVLG